MCIGYIHIYINRLYKTLRAAKSEEVCVYVCGKKGGGVELHIGLEI